MKKPGQRTYQHEDEKSLVISSAYIEGGYGLLFDCRGVTKQLQNIVKSIKSWWCDNDILEKSSMWYYR